MTAKPITSKPQAITDGQKKQYLRFVEDTAEKALREAGLDKDSIQRLIEHGDELQAALLEAIKKLVVSQQFADEEVESSCGYLADYKPLSVGDQCKRLGQLFPELGVTFDTEIAEQELPDGAEGWFAIPRWEKLGNTYAEALRKVIAKLQEVHGEKFKNWREGELTDKHVKLTEGTAARLKKLGDEQKGNEFLVIACQFGMRHRGRSVRRAREVFTTNEFGLDPFSVAVMMLTHPTRLQANEDLCIDAAAGADYRPAPSGGFLYNLRFYCFDGKLYFNYTYIDYANGLFGSASAFGASA